MRLSSCQQRAAPGERWLGPPHLPEVTGSSPVPPIMRLRAFVVVLCVVVTPLSAQNRAERLAHFRAFAESSLADRGSWSGSGAVVGGVAGGLAFAGAFYHFAHRDGAPNNTVANLGASLVGASFGAITGALAGAFVGALIPKRHALPPP